MSGFDKFETETTKNFDAFIHNPRQLKLFKNPAYLIQSAHQYIMKDPELADELLTHAYNMDRVLGFQALYFRALARLQRGYDLFRRKKERKSANDSYHRQAKSDLEQAIRIAYSIMTQFSGVMFACINDPMCQLSEQFNNKIALLTRFVHMCSKAIEKIDKCPSDFVCKFENFIGLEQAYQDMKDQQQQAENEEKKIDESESEQKGGKNSKNNSELDNYDEFVPYEEIEELMDSGLRHFYELGYAKPKPPLYAVVWMAILGAAQICLGAILATASFGMASTLAFACVQKWVNYNNNVIKLFVSVRLNIISWKTNFELKFTRLDLFKIQSLRCTNDAIFRRLNFLGYYHHHHHFNLNSLAEKIKIEFSCLPCSLISKKCQNPSTQIELSLRKMSIISCLKNTFC